ncbi:alginate export family protein [Dissulfurirhabdus thermomarina]|uniref:Alginate export family protein n=1 Tax=Dissulfurirhabdus thermomarina TaxID=1765737 RepID=A0A6N9TNW4_DISTH|nr:alginate export family protein [Dissulfurirhabdus thermomarina]NDY42982.1 alginate export family protein [Dissulfurirhabdus thermomarina]NMX23799.1 alginate export family protein [Dissulfurirhabdus thermomarina]
MRPPRGPLPARALLLLAALLFGLRCAAARAGVTLDGEIRERFEAWNGLNKKAYGDAAVDSAGTVRGEPDDRLLLQRVVAGLTGEGRRIDWRLHLYDARVWGWSLDQDDFVKNRGTSDEVVMDPYEEYLELYDAQVTIKGIGTRQSRLVLGRQVIWYGDRRVFGPGSWGNAIGWLWDAARYSLRRGRDFADVWYGQTKTKDPESLSLAARHAYQGVGLYARHAWSATGGVEPFFAWKKARFFDRDRREDTRFFGCRLYEDDWRGLWFDLTWIRETGRFEDRRGPDPDVSAYAYVAKAGWTFRDLPWRPRLGLGRVYASGDPRPGDDRVRTFSSPFGSTDGRHYGRLDVMSWGNMVDDQASLDLAPRPGLSVHLALHRFSLAEKADKWTYYGYRVPGNRHAHIGDEFDAVIQWRPARDWDVQVFYAVLRAGDFITENGIARNDAGRLVCQVTWRFAAPLDTAAPQSSKEVSP